MRIPEIGKPLTILCTEPEPLNDGKNFPYENLAGEYCNGCCFCEMCNISSDIRLLMHNFCNEFNRPDDKNVIFKALFHEEDKEKAKQELKRLKKELNETEEETTKVLLMHRTFDKMTAEERKNLADKLQETTDRESDARKKLNYFLLTHADTTDEPPTIQ